MNNDITTYRQDPSVSYKDEEKNQVLSVIEDYNTALNLLDYYDHQYMKRPEGHKATYVITYEECRSIIDMMNFKKESELFGNENGKIGVCCYIKRAEESVRYTHSVVFILHWISINYGMPYIGFRFKIGACCYTCVKRYQTSIRNRSMLLQS